MITAILPICIKKNIFWLSSEGIKCLDDFLNECIQITEINDFIVVSQDDVVFDLAEKYRMLINNTFAFDSINKPYTFEQIRVLALNFKKYCKTKKDVLLVLDHRNLYLSAEGILEALSLHKQNPEYGIISLAFCRDYPCQYRSFFEFLDCIVFNFYQRDENDKFLDQSYVKLSKEIKCKVKEFESIIIDISVKSPNYIFTFYSKSLNHKAFIAQVIPLKEGIPQYLQIQNIYIPTCEYKELLEIKTTKITGMIVILTSPSQTGEYDTMEVFAPQNAPWKYSGNGTTVIDTKNHQPMLGRQQFPKTYTYDGSLFVIGDNQLKETSKLNLIPLVLKNSILVDDLVDYLYFVSTMQTEKATKGSKNFQ